MQYCDLKRQYQAMKNDIDEAIFRVMQSGNYILGEEVARFEEEVASFHEVNFAVALGSGTDALYLSSMIAGINPGDEVITTPLSMIATIQGAAFLGAKPIFCDINFETLNIDENRIEEKISQKTKALIPVHFFGQPVKMVDLMKVAHDKKIFVIEDAAQSMGARFQGKMVGGFGDIGCLSFFPTKNLGGYGDGGMVLTNNEEISSKIKILRAHGAIKKYHHTELGINSRLDSIQAAILRVKLKKLEDMNEKRRQHAQRYSQAFSDIKQLILPKEIEGGYHVFHQYSVFVKERDELSDYLKKAGIPTMIYYPIPLHLQPVFSKYGHKEGDFPNAERACREVLCLPVYPELEESEQDLIINKVIDYFK